MRCQHHEDGVSIRLGARHILRGQRAARTGLVFQHYRLPELLLELHRQRPPQQIRAAARRVGNHQLDGFVGPVGLRCCCRGQPGGQAQCDATQRMPTRDRERSHDVSFLPVSHGT
ncbi:hypothetical protein SDC9_168403 [bioreactor metagenome]|uniref:Uncharacterized protein n=1 Tax=bioreactor metagenome TaxID=1076179 RepID=A0A645GAC5_9ZZZZ